MFFHWLETVITTRNHNQILKLEAVRSCKTLVTTYKSTRHHNTGLAWEMEGSCVLTAYKTEAKVLLNITAAILTKRENICLYRY